MTEPLRTPTSLVARVHAAIRDVPDFPTPGINFKDITPLLADPELLTDVVRAMADPFAREGITHVVAIESRGFLFGVAVALVLQAAFVPARKPGKLPRATVRESYTLEYRNDVLELHADALDASSRVLVVDDVLATGGTAEAAVRLAQRLGAIVAGVSVLSELAFLDGRSRLPGLPVHTLVTYRASLESVRND